MTISQIAARNACFLDGVSNTAQDLRDGQNAMMTSTGATGTTGIAARAGVRYAVGSPLASVWTSGMNFNLNAGTCFVQGTSSATAGLWPLVLDLTTLLTVGASDPTNPRIDSVIAVVSDVGTVSSTALFKILPGTPAGSPVAPTLPANALLLANIAVAAGAVTLSAGSFTDTRVYSCAAGGILIHPNTTGATITGPPGSYLHDLNANRLKVANGAGAAVQPNVGAFAALSASTAGPGAFSSSSNTTLLTVNATVDGFTELAITVTWQSIIQTGSPSVGSLARFLLLVDGSVPNSFSEWDYKSDSTNGVPGNGGQFTTWATPANGARVITLVGISPGSQTFWITNPLLRVAPSLAG